MHSHNPIETGRPRPAEAARPSTEGNDEGGHSHSMWWMVACCAPMVLIALAILLGVLGPR